MRFLKSIAAAICACSILPYTAVADAAHPQGKSVSETPVIKADRNIAGQPIIFPQRTAR